MSVFGVQGVSSQNPVSFGLRRANMAPHFCVHFLPKIPVNFRLERKALMRACPRGVKATSGLCLWPDSLEEQPPLPEAQWEELGQVGLAQTFPRCWSLAWQIMVFAKRGSAFFFFFFFKSSLA